MSITPNEWNILEPSVIRDAISGRLGFQTEFGTTFVSGATNALALKQNPIDGSPEEGDAYLYIGTTNGGVYVRQYDYQTDTWSDEWTWLSKPSGLTTGGYDGAQGVGALALSPDGNFVAVGRGGSTNYNAYTPNGPSIQIGRVLGDGTVDWLPVQEGIPLSGASANSNVRALIWQDDGLYASFAKGNMSQDDFPAQFGRFGIDSSGLITSAEVIGSIGFGNLSIAASGVDAPIFLSPVSGIVSAVVPGSDVLAPVTGAAWEEIRTERLVDELLGRVTVAADPDVAGQHIVLLGWFNYKAPDMY